MDEKMLKHGAMSWFELSTSDTEGAKEFYGKIFGWEYEKFPEAPSEYNVIKCNGEEMAGLMPTPPEAGDMPPLWAIYVTVDDAAATLKQVEELGGKVIFPPMPIPKVGLIAGFLDPQGAMICICQYEQCKKD